MRFRSVIILLCCIMLINVNAQQGKDSVKNNYQKIFIHELWSWNTNESLWPETDLSTFNEWLSVEHLEVCYDLLNSPIFKMELFA